MNRLEYVHDLHETENIREIITAAVSAFCEQKTDAILTVNLGFENLIDVEPFYDTIPKVELSVLKAEDHIPAFKPSSEWAEYKNHRPAHPSNSSLNNTNQTSSVEHLADSKPPTPKKEKSREEVKAPKEIKKIRAKLWELPSGEMYAVKYEDINKRKLNFRKSTSDVETAQEVPAIREKLEQDASVNDRTDGDCSSIKTDVDNSRESVLEESDKKETSPEPKIEPPARKFRISLRSRPYCGEFMITDEKDGVVTFFCYTKHLKKKQDQGSHSSQSPPR